MRSWLRARRVKRWRRYIVSNRCDARPGRATVELLLTLPDGRQVIAETTLLPVCVLALRWLERVIP